MSGVLASVSTVRPIRFPQVAAVATNNTTSDGTSHTLGIPSGTVAGDLLLAILAFDGVPTFSGLTNFTQLDRSTDGSANDVVLEVWYKVAVGGETDLTVTSSTAQIGTIHVMRINQWHGSQAPEKGTAANGTSTTPDPPSVTATWGSTKNLFIALTASDTDDAVTAYPTNYSGNNFTSNQGGGTGHISVGVATRELAADTDDPGTFTIAGSREWTTQTIVIRP